MEYIIGVDIGTTSTKAIAFDLNGRIVDKANVEYSILNTRPSWSEQRPDEIFDAVMNSIKTVVDKNKEKNNRLLAVSFSSAMHSTMAVDDKGEPLTNLIIWADTRSKEYAQRLKETRQGHEIYMKTGTPIHPMAPLSKLAWLRDNMKEVYQKAYKYISIKEYVFYRLFGQYIVDYSIASATGLFNIYAFKWEQDALDVAGISCDRLSAPVPTTYTLKGIKREYAEYLGIDVNTPFIAGASDGCLANLGTNAIKPGDAAVTIGTSGAIRVISDSPKSDPQERIFSYILTKDRYVLGGPINNGGIVFRWFRDNFAADEVQKAKQEGMDAYDILTQEAQKIPAGSDGLIFLPYLLGERAPHWDADARGVFFGINIKHTRGHFIRALLEGVIYAIYDVGKALEETAGDINKIYVTGGFVRSPLWVQILSDVFGRKVLQAESYESSCLGAAILGMKALGIIDGLDEVERFVPVSKEYLPDKKNNAIYKEIFEMYARLYNLLKGEFSNAANLQDRLFLD
ncbi:gluconate kinase, FGGY family [Caldanaerobius fijiensis DSM 17918]|uniref:Gluconate kinase, FGGY family n=1 Tax=Caldanaerobius fijiensis DSM 17918 TaxID=1121256 RepID=A0A1M5FC26_9THEO|nr:gluconokinase [Caldanaerobius fijiensis]SHF89105.1 gluconate kinase, FGGY family [Caldanaerobius fijiensis DSM 17918]